MKADGKVLGMKLAVRNIKASAQMVTELGLGTDFRNKKSLLR